MPLSFTVFFFSLVFDVRGAAEGGGALQFFSFAVCIASGLYSIISMKADSGRSIIFKLSASLLCIHLVAIVASAVIAGVPIANTLRTGANYGLYLLGYLVGYIAIETYGLNRTIQSLFLVSLISGLFALASALTSGESLFNLRYALISPAIYIWMALLIFLLIWEKSNIGALWLLQMATLCLIVITATRSILACYFSLVFIAVTVRGTERYSLPLATARGAIAFSALALALTVPLYVLIPEAIGRIVERTFSFEDIGFDITTATRLAEIDYQLVHWRDTTFSFLFGNGVGAPYGFSGPSAALLEQVLGAESVDIEWWPLGHSFWVYSLFSQGLLLGLLHPGLIAFSLFRSFTAIRDQKAESEYSDEKTRATILGFLLLAAFIGYTLGGNPLGPRLSAQLFGVALAILHFGLSRNESLHV